MEYAGLTTVMAKPADIKSWSPLGWGRWCSDFDSKSESARGLLKNREPEIGLFVPANNKDSPDSSNTDKIS